MNLDLSKILQELREETGFAAGRTPAGRAQQRADTFRSPTPWHLHVPPNR